MPSCTDAGLGVSVVCPGFFPSQVCEGAHFQDERARALAERLMRDSPITAQDVARAAVRAMHREEFYVVLPWRAAFSGGCGGCFPERRCVSSPGSPPEARKLWTRAVGLKSAGQRCGKRIAFGVGDQHNGNAAGLARRTIDSSQHLDGRFP